MRLRYSHPGAVDLWRVPHSLALSQGPIFTCLYGAQGKADGTLRRPPRNGMNNEREKAYMRTCARALSPRSPLLLEQSLPPTPSPLCELTLLVVLLYVLCILGLILDDLT